MSAQLEFSKMLHLKGISQIPLKYGEKTPRFSWKKYTSTLPTSEELIGWHKTKTNMGIVTGKLSGIVALDLDSPEAIKYAKEHFEESPIKIITARGEQWIYGHPKNAVELKNKVKLKIGGKELDIDIRGDGGYVVAPYSIHPSGTQYRASGDWENFNVSDLPEFPLHILSSKPNKEQQSSNKPLKRKILRKIEKMGQAIEGKGGDNLTYQIACTLRRDYGLTKSESLAYMIEWNKHNKPPWSLADLIKKIDNAIQYGEGPIKQKRKLTLTPIQELLSEPREDIEWLWEGRIPATGVSIIVSKPKSGKTTTARGFAVNVSQGKSFLGFPTKKGPVIYIAAEENRDQFAKYLSLLDIKDCHDLYIHTGLLPPDGIDELDEEAGRIKPVLIIVDTLIRSINATDTNDYAQMARALEPFEELAAKHKCHVLLTHHANKMNRSAGDNVLGSTAIFGSVATLISLEKKKEGVFISTTQRYGDHLEPHEISFDPETRSVSMGTSQLVKHQTKIEDRIASFVESNPGCTEAEIQKSVEGTKQTLLRNLRSMVKGGVILREGKGKKGDPYKYRMGAPQTPMESRF